MRPNMEEVSKRLGRIAGNSSDLISESLTTLESLRNEEGRKGRSTKQERRIVESLLSCWIRIQQLSEEEKYRFIEADVWPCPYKTIFFLEFPKDLVITKMLGRSLAPEALSFLLKLLEKGCDPNRMTSLLVPYFAKQLSSPSGSLLCEKVVEVLMRLALFSNSILFEDEDLFFGLAEGIRSSPSSYTSTAEFAFRVVEGFTDTLVARPLVKALSAYAFSNLSLDSTSTFGFFSVLAHGEAWESYMVNLICNRFPRKGFRPLSATILLNALLRHDSVRLVVCLERAGILGQLRSHSATFSHDEAWRKVYEGLEEMWPSQNSIFPCVPCVVCPITLEPPHRPVVASDGITYERTAILTLMAKVGMSSPVTRGRLTYRLHKNFALQDGLPPPPP